MTSDASRLVRPGVVAQWSAAKTATRLYCQVARGDYDAVLRCIDFHRAAGGPAREFPLSGSSRVKRKFHARFLGGCGRVNRLHLPGAIGKLSWNSCRPALHSQAAAPQFSKADAHGAANDSSGRLIQSDMTLVQAKAQDAGQVSTMCEVI